VSSVKKVLRKKERKPVLFQKRSVTVFYLWKGSYYFWCRVMCPKAIILMKLNFILLWLNWIF